ncbi:MAG TPA: glycine zipper 2TM domain-containing protein [Rhodocyclaceae bacterium]
MRKTLITITLLAAGQLAATAFAADAAARYAADKKLCAEESTSSARMQCLRDAKAEYEKALGSSRAAAACKECGTVKSVSVEEKKGEGGPMGMIAGGVAGALVGNQIGSGTGRTVATVAGAAGGAYAGKKIEEHVRTTKVWAVHVRMDDGAEKTFHFEKDPGFKGGDPVRLSGSSIVRR